MFGNYILGIKLEKEINADSYLAKLPAVKHLCAVKELSFPSRVTFFVGENGTGKSTLLEAIAVASGLNAEGGSKDFFFSTYDSHSDLHQYITTIKSISPKDSFFLRAESFYNTASYLDRISTLERYGGKSFHEQSHGESFIALVANRFEGNGLYLLDEPESALSPQSIMSLVCKIHELVGRDSQFIIATHSPILMAYPNSQILQFTDGGIAEVEYRETAHYKLTKQFIDSPERMMKYLLD